MENFKPGSVIRKMTHAYYAATVLSILLLFVGLVVPFPFGYLGAGSMYIAFGQLAFPDYEWMLNFAICWFLGFPAVLTIGYLVTVFKKWYKLFRGLLFSEACVVVIYSIWCFAQDNAYGGGHFLMEGLFSLAYWYAYRFVLSKCNHGTQSSSDSRSEFSCQSDSQSD